MTVPVLSGAYAITVQGQSASGVFASRLLRALFSNTSKTASVTGSMCYGTDGGGLVQAAVDYTSPFTATATQLTMDGATVAILYGPVVGGIAQSYKTVGLVSINGVSFIECADAMRVT